MNLFTVNKDYLNYLQKLNIKFFKTDFSGLITRLNGFIYLVPVVGLSDNDFEKDGSLKKSTPSIFRMMENNNPIGKALLSNMFPVPYKEVEMLSINSIDEKLIPLVEKRIEYIKINQKRIQTAIKRLYKQKTKGYNQSYLQSTLDFKKMEKECIDWETEKYGKHYNRFPDSKYFIENPFVTGETEYFLMNKNIKVAKVVIDNETQNVTSILEILQDKYAPLECFDNGELTASSITSWFKGRGIPSWREGLDDFLSNSGIKTEILLLNRAFGLSLTDQYWLNPVTMEMDWNDINFFDHDFNSSDFIEASFENKIINKNKIDFYTPNNTSDGMLKKAWIVGENKNRYLLKGSYKQKGFEPFCEVLANLICKAIDVPCVEYSIDYLGKTTVSKCKCFINKDTELISAYAILKNNQIDLKELSSEKVYQKYIQILKNNGINNPEVEIAKMFICDYLIVNQDRHLGNFGIIRDVNDLKWVSIAPVYDSGQAMYSQKEVYEMNFNTASGSFFNQREMDFEKILKLVLSNVSITIDFQKLIEAADTWKSILVENQIQSSLSDERIEICYKGLLVRIDKLKSYL